MKDDLQIKRLGLFLKLSVCPSWTGYATHLVGKWHLGFYKWPYVPTKRGFDTAYGFWDGAEDHFDHTRDGVVDFRDNLEPVKDLNGTYATNAYADVSSRSPHYCFFHSILKASQSSNQTSPRGSLCTSVFSHT